MTGSRRGTVNVTGMGFGCLVLFLLPFCVIGLGALVVSLGAMVRGAWAEAGFAAIFALTFGGAGFGMLIAAWYGRKATARSAALREANPERPWLWREDWARGMVRDSSRGTMIAAWVFAGFWNLISIPAAYFAVRTALDEKNYAVLFALIFPLIGLGLLTWALRATTRYLKFGISILELTTRPGIINGKLAGVIRIPGLLLPPEGFRVALRSIHRRTTGSGKSRSTSETILWQEEGSFHPARQADGTVIPVGFAIPADARATDGSDSDNCYLWRLQVTGEVPGVDYSAQFEVPVFSTELGETTGPDIQVLTPAPLDLTHYRQPVDSRIQVEVNRRGTEIVFPPARNPAAGIFTTVFFLGWSGAIYAMLRLGAPMLFPIIFGLFDLLLFYGVLAHWLGRSTVVGDTGVLTVDRRILGYGGERRIEGDTITSIEAVIGMQMGSTPYYDIKVTRTDGRPVTLGGGIRDKREAQWIAGLLVTAVKGSHALASS